MPWGIKQDGDCGKKAKGCSFIPESHSVQSHIIIPLHFLYSQLCPNMKAGATGRGGRWAKSQGRPEKLGGFQGPC